MVLFGVDVLVHLVAWFQAGISSIGVAHVAVATIMLVILSSDSVTDFTATISNWCQGQMMNVGCGNNTEGCRLRS